MSLANELMRKDIRVNAIAPGFIDTEATRKVTPEKMLAGMTMQTPMRRLGTPDELVRTRAVHALRRGAAT